MWLVKRCNGPRVGVRFVAVPSAAPHGPSAQIAEVCAARALPFRQPMRVLEARFHPHQGGEDGFIVVAHVIWEGDVANDSPMLSASTSLGECGSPTTILAKLHFLVASSTPDVFGRLQRLKSRYWSFVEVAPSLDVG
jgi:hypothetical protein